MPNKSANALKIMPLLNIENELKNVSKKINRELVTKNFLNTFISKKIIIDEMAVNPNNKSHLYVPLNKKFKSYIGSNPF